jgi:hypothetical protein
MLELNKALKELSANEKARMYFWFSEKGTKGKPTVLVSKSQDPTKDKDLNALLEDENFKLAAHGTMKIEPVEGVLVLKPKTKKVGDGALQKGAFTALLNAKAGTYVKQVAVGEPGEDEAEGPSANKTPDATATGTGTGGTATGKTAPAGLKEAQEREAATKLQEAAKRLLKTVVYGSRQAPDEGVRILKNVDQQLRSFDTAFTKIFPGSKLRPAQDIDQVLDLIPKKV